MWRAALEPLEDRQTIEVRQTQIQQNDIRPVGGGGSQSRFAVDRSPDLEAQGLEDLFNETSTALVVIDDEQGSGTVCRSYGVNS